MKKTDVCVLALLLLGGCAPAYPPRPAGTTVDTKTYAISCDDAHRYAAKALKLRSLKITAVERSPSGGTVKGTSEKAEVIEVRLSCGAGGVTVASTGGHWLEQGVRLSFSNLVDQGDRLWPPPRGPKIFVEQLSGPEAKLEFPQELEPLGMTALRLRAVNGGERTIRIEPRRIRGRMESGGAPALSEESVKAKLASIDPKVEGKLLRATTLKHGEEATGFVFLPAGRYSSAAVLVVDTGTGEADEFEIFFSP